MFVNKVLPIQQNYCSMRTSVRSEASKLTLNGAHSATCMSTILVNVRNGRMPVPYITHFLYKTQDFRGFNIILREPT